MLFKEIGLTSNEVGKAKRIVQIEDAGLKAKAVLRKWKKKEGKKATREALLKALAECQGKLIRPIEVQLQEKQWKKV